MLVRDFTVNMELFQVKWSNEVKKSGGILRGTNKQHQTSRILHMYSMIWPFLLSLDFGGVVINPSYILSF